MMTQIVEARLIAGAIGSMNPSMFAELAERLLSGMNRHMVAFASNKKGRLG